METMKFSVLLVLVVFSGAVVFTLFSAVAYLLRYLGINFSEAPTRVYEKAEKVVARIEYFSEHDGWHVVFNRGFGTCYGILTNLNKGQVKAGIEVEASILSEPDGSCGFYQLAIEE